MPCQDFWRRQETDPLETLTIRALPAGPVRDYALAVSVTDTTKSTALINLRPFSAFQLKKGISLKLRGGCVYHLSMLVVEEPGDDPKLDVTFLYNSVEECQQRYGRTGSGVVHQWTVVVVL